MKIVSALAAAAVTLSLAGAALAEGMCDGYQQQTVKADTTVVASVPAPAPTTDGRK